MPRIPQKSQYKTKDIRILYVLHSPLSKEFYIGHCKQNSLLPIYRQHCSGKRYQTSVCIEELKKQNLHPCLHILEEIYATQVEAYSHVIAWTKIFIEAGYNNLDKGNIVHYVEQLYEKSEKVFNEYANTNLTAMCCCESCMVSHYGRKKCPKYTGDVND